jgi:hypothetical protein
MILGRGAPCANVRIFVSMEHFDPHELECILGRDGVRNKMREHRNPYCDVLQFLVDLPMMFSVWPSKSERNRCLVNSPRRDDAWQGAPHFQDTSR